MQEKLRKETLKHIATFRDELWSLIVRTNEALNEEENKSSAEREIFENLPRDLSEAMQKFKAEVHEYDARYSPAASVERRIRQTKSEFV